MFNLDNIQSDKSVIDISAKYLFDDPEGDELAAKGVITYAVRITNIPLDRHASTQIYARAYYIFEYNDNGDTITVYGDIVNDSYEPQKDINDGSFSDWS